MPTYLSTEQLSASLGMRDLTDPAAGPHAMQELLDSVVEALTSSWGVPERLLRISSLVPGRRQLRPAGLRHGSHHAGHPILAIRERDGNAAKPHLRLYPAATPVSRSIGIPR
jgi:hypothetical protein